MENIDCTGTCEIQFFSSLMCIDQNVLKNCKNSKEKKINNIFHEKIDAVIEKNSLELQFVIHISCFSDMAYNYSEFDWPMCVVSFENTVASADYLQARI